MARIKAALPSAQPDGPFMIGRGRSSQRPTRGASWQATHGGKCADFGVMVADAEPLGLDACATGAGRAEPCAARGVTRFAVLEWTNGAHARLSDRRRHPSGHRAQRPVPAPLARVANGVRSCRAYTESHSTRQQCS